MVHIVWNEQDSERVWQEGRDDYRPYLFEIMRYLGYTCKTWDPETWMVERPPGVTLLIGSATPQQEWAEACLAYCEEGNALLSIGDVYGLEAVLGVRMNRDNEAGGRIEEGWIDFEDNLLSKGLRGSFHVFHGVLVEPVENDVIGYGKWKQRGGMEFAHPAIVMRDIGRGRIALLAFDLMKTFCLIQQGVPVLRDAIPAPDGTGPVDDGYLKTDDGTVLDWSEDRDYVGDLTDPFYLHPIVDEIRILFTRILYLLQESAGVREGQLWFWPESLPAIGHISHDSDNNDPEAAAIMLDRLAEAGIRSTWCVIQPGYPDWVNQRITAAGNEIALHFNARLREGHRFTEWEFRGQLEALIGQFPELRIVSNKNHYLRWEGDVAFYHWCERAGIMLEQSKGGTKKGNKGFLFGTCHPNIPIAGPAERNRLFNVVSLPTLAWDPPMEIRCSTLAAKALVDRCRDVYGVAHFLYHPGSMKLVPGAGDALVELCRYGREQGMEWWTSNQLLQWHRIRRQVRVDSNGHEFRISTSEDVRGLTLLIPKMDGDSFTVTSDDVGVVREVSVRQRFGLSYMEAIIDLSSGTTVLKREEIA